ncbi:MAG: nickel superoxide dismutase [Chlamydiales bacterium]
MKYIAPILSLAFLVAAFSPAPRALHCQVPCGVYGDGARITMMLEDATTIEKGMKSILELEAADAKNYNQIVRWVTTKDEHASHIQETVAAYWLTQRIKAPAGDADEAARAKYLGQLELLHGLTVAAMKCKQTTDVAHVQSLRKLTDAFAGTYFSEEDLAHMKGHH